MTGIRACVTASAGAAVAALAWLVLVPWDLSEVTQGGRPIEGGGDDNGLQIAFVGMIVVALGVVALARASTRALASAFVAGGLAAWTVLFAWRAGVSETDGANMFMAPLVALFIPATVVPPSWFAPSPPGWVAGKAPSGHNCRYLPPGTQPQRR